jgi:hypothetical protein
MISSMLQAITESGSSRSHLFSNLLLCSRSRRGDALRRRRGIASVVAVCVNKGLGPLGPAGILSITSHIMIAACVRISQVHTWHTPAHTWHNARAHPRPATVTQPEPSRRQQISSIILISDTPMACPSVLYAIPPAGTRQRTLSHDETLTWCLAITMPHSATCTCACACLRRAT